MLQFDLRLTQLIPSSAPTTLERWEGKDDGHCFCMQGHGCDPHWKWRRRTESNFLCADATIDRQRSPSTRYHWLDRFYAFILPPVTKWDGARFLTLAVDPWARYPLRIEYENGIHVDHAQQQQVDKMYNYSDNTVCEIQPTPIEDRNKIFGPSEQSHAFLPLLPLVIRYTANFFIDIIPPKFLPATYEGTLTLCAIIINMVSFVIAALSLYDLTIYLLLADRLNNLVRRKQQNNIDDGGSTLPENDMMASQEHLLAKTAARIFCINPAGVFFTAVYSESMFAMLTFTGHAIFARGQYCNDYLTIASADVHKHGMSLPKGSDRSYYWWRAKLYWLPSTLFWMLASFTRSNGSFTSIWLLIVGIAKCVSCCIRGITGMHTTKSTTIKVITLLLCHGVLASLVALPVLFHDWRGYNIHCQVTESQQQQQTLLSPWNHIIPEWCERYAAGTGCRFSLYAHVQRKYWNVGLFRYYEMKQIPNFLLALPLLTLSFTAVVVWIACSWRRHMTSERNTVHCSIGGVCIIAQTRALLRWTCLALAASTNESSPESGSQSTMLHQVLIGPKFLPHYAILAGFALVGTFLAHVQISTRLICSSCPAILWFFTSLLLLALDVGSGVQECRVNDNVDGASSLFPHASRVGRLLYPYFVLYNLLGVLLHVNFLPWT